MTGKTLNAIKCLCAIGIVLMKELLTVYKSIAVFLKEYIFRLLLKGGAKVKGPCVVRKGPERNQMFIGCVGGWLC